MLRGGEWVSCLQGPGKGSSVGTASHRGTRGRDSDGGRPSRDGRPWGVSFRSGYPKSELLFLIQIEFKRGDRLKEDEGLSGKTLDQRRRVGPVKKHLS